MDLLSELGFSDGSDGAGEHAPDGAALAADAARPTRPPAAPPAGPSPASRPGRCRPARCWRASS